MLQAAIAAYFSNRFSIALIIVAGTAAIVVALLAAFGVEAKGVRLNTGAGTVEPNRASRRTGP